LIRSIKQKDIFQELYDTIVNENEIDYHDFTLTPPSVIWNYGKMDFFHDSIRILNNWCNIIDNNTIPIDNIVFITNNYLDIIDEIKADKNVFLITNSEMVKEYNTKDIKVINYDKYYLKDINYIIKKQIENDKYNWKNSKGKRFMNIDVLYFLNLFAEAFNYKDLNYTCSTYLYHRMNKMEWKETKNNFEQYVLFFDYMENNIL
jgi:hypothetical protein